MRLLLATLVALGIVAAAVWAWAAAATDPAYVMNEEANRLYRAGDLGAALEKYREVEKLGARPAISVNAGNTLYRLNDFTRALVDHDAAVEKAEGLVKAIASYDRGNTLFRLGRYADARESYKDALRLDPTNVDAKVNLELTQRLLEQLARPGNQGDPGAAGRPGQGPSQPQGGQDGPQGPPGQEDSLGELGGDRPAQGSDSGIAGNAPPNLGRAVDAFRQNLTTEEALQLLDALRAQQRGVETLLEGRPTQRSGQEPLY